MRRCQKKPPLAFLQLIRDVADFPIPGIRFKDISPLLAQEGAITSAVDMLERAVSSTSIDLVLAVEARGFVLGAPLADRLGAGFVMVRKPGKLPGETDAFGYTCEYSEGELEVTKGIVRLGARCLVVDDVLATGGTARATADFVLSSGGIVSGYCFLVEIGLLRGRTRLGDAPVFSVIRYDANGEAT